METRVKITQEESQAVQRLYIDFKGYCNILGYLAQFGSLDTDVFDKKWAEAVELNYQLEQLKAEMDLKYHPQDDVAYTTFEFDFINREIVYTDG